MNPKELVKEYCIKSLVCCFSGGKDSLAMTHHLHSELRNTDVKLYVVYADTGIMLPCTRPFVEETCKYYGWNLTVVEGNFFEKAETRGMPRMKHRWCCYECKIKPIATFTRMLPPQRCEAVGIRRDESLKRSKLKNEFYYLRRGAVWKYAPILSWTEKQVLNYIRNNELPMPPNYKLGLKETCQCGVYSSKKQMLILKAQYPELWNKIVQLEANFRKGGAAFYFRNKPVYTREIAAQKTLNENE